MEKMIPPCSLPLTGEEEINPPPKPRILAWRDLNPKSSTRKNLLKTMDPHSLRPLAICRRREGRGPAVMETERWRRRAAALEDPRGTAGDTPARVSFRRQYCCALYSTHNNTTVSADVTFSRYLYLISHTILLLHTYTNI